MPATKPTRPPIVLQPSVPVSAPAEMRTTPDDVIAPDLEDHLRDAKAVLRLVQRVFDHDDGGDMEFYLRHGAVEIKRRSSLLQDDNEKGGA